MINTQHKRKSNYVGCCAECGVFIGMLSVIGPSVMVWHSA